MKVFITREIPEIAIKLLHKNKFSIVIHKGERKISRTELIKNVRDADGVISLLSDNFDESVISEMKKCKVIANYAVGFNNINLKYAREKGIVVTNTPDVLTDATADLAIALALSCARRIFEGDKIIRNNKFIGWSPKLLLGFEMRGKIFGIIGSGRIGTATAIRAHAFGTKIIYFSNSINLELQNKTAAKKVSLNYLLKNSDFISIHLPLTEKTYHLLDKSKLMLLKKTSILINTARGEIIDEKALIEKFKKKEIFAAGLDVYENEPEVNNELLKLKNVVLLPHIGSASVEARNKMAVLSAKNIINVLKGKMPITQVN